MLEVINREYVTTARAKGLADRRVIWGHALKNAMLPVVTVMGVQMGYLLGGSILVETVFSWPGLGLQLFRAISSRDLPLVQGGVMLVSAVFVCLNLAVDLLYRSWTHGSAIRDHGDGAAVARRRPALPQRRERPKARDADLGPAAGDPWRWRPPCCCSCSWWSSSPRR